MMRGIWNCVREPTFSKCLALEAHHVHGEDPHVHVFAPDNADSPSCRRRCRRSRCWGGTARTLPRQPPEGPSARGAAQNDVCLAAPVYLGQQCTDQTQTNP